MESRSTFRNPDSTHVFPPSSLLSTKAFHTPSSSLEAGASQVPSDNTMGLLRTGPLPPLSPETSSFASDQVAPLSFETLYHVSQKSISFPTLKNNVMEPDGSLKRTGFQ